MRRILLLGLICLGLAACASPHTLTKEQVQSLGISNIQVTIPPTAGISWATEQEYYEKTQGGSPQDGKEHVRKKLQALVQAEYERQLKPRFVGPHKVKLDVTIKMLVVPSLAARVFVNDMALFKANYDVVDLKTGELLARFEDVGGSSQKMMGGLLAPLSDAAGLSGHDPTPALIANHAAIAREWLAKGRQ